MYIEAAIDFPEEEVDFLQDRRISQQVRDILATFEQIESAARQGVILQEGMTVVIAGPPNAGKSTLLNALSGRESAIVTNIPGTTRDIMREQILIDGLPIHILDTAGLRESDDPVEQEGIRRAKQAMENADRVLFMRDARDKTPPLPLEDRLSHVPLTIVNNKVDLLGEPSLLTQSEGKTSIAISAKNGDGIELLREHLKQCVGYQASTEGGFLARRRHLDALTRAKDSIYKGLQQFEKQLAGELLAEDLRQAQLALSEITGEFTADDLLGEIFSKFCIGK